jgi:hypothetical protein
MRLSSREHAVVTGVHIAVGVAAIALNALAGIYGGWCWWRAESAAWFWRLLRAGQAVVVLEAVLGGVLQLTQRKAPGIHVLYGLLPLAVSFVAEQLRVASAQMVLDQRGFESPEEVGRLPEQDQRVVVVAIVQREVGVMALAAIVIVVLLARAAGTA